MPATVIVGAQWGDEGKGKIVDLLAQHSDLVCRYNGGPNAGHTIVADGETYKLKHIPSGILRGKECVIGAGCVVDPQVLIEELEDLEERGLGQLVERYVHRDALGVTVVTYLFPTDVRWRREAPPGLIETVTGGDPGIAVTGGNVAAEELRHIFVRDAIKSVLFGLGIVFVLLMADFRSVKLSLIALAQPI